MESIHCLNVECAGRNAELASDIEECPRCGGELSQSSNMASLSALKAKLVKQNKEAEDALRADIAKLQADLAKPVTPATTPAT